MTGRPLAVFVSFRLGGTDGVSVESAKWEGALSHLGYATRRVGGEILDDGRDDDVVIPGLRIRAADPPTVRALQAALDGADLVVVENLLSLPLNLPAARSLVEALDGHDRVLLHHHDLPWQRSEFESVEDLPPRIYGAVHVVINDLSRLELVARGFDAHLVRNHFDLSPALGDRAATRARLGLGERDILVFHPVRAIERKNVPGALALCAAIDERLPGHRVHYWLPGPAEDGYAARLDELVAQTRVRVLRAEAKPIADAYAACDLVAFPSMWEGFGNPVIESVAHRRPLAVAAYPVLAELEALGLEFLGCDEPGAVAAAVSGVRDMTPEMERNLEVARAHVDLDLLPGRIAALLAGAGWALPVGTGAVASAQATP